MNAVHETHHADQQGILIGWVRRYNLLVAVFFGGRRGAVNKALAAASGARLGSRALDVGSGPGRFASALAAAVGARGSILGVDPSAPMVDYANRHAGRQANCGFELAAAQSLELPDAQFDVVTSTFVMHHIPHDRRDAAMAHMFRVLRPGGRLLIADMHPTGRLIPSVVRQLSRIASHNDADPLKDVDVRRYMEPLREAGFTDLRFTVLRPWTGYLTATKPE
ncbi:MAG: methyltransferase domain-containing protein [Sciscionella sp.]